jgi:hypothetical protein
MMDLIYWGASNEDNLFGSALCDTRRLGCFGKLFGPEQSSFLATAAAFFLFTTRSLVAAIVVFLVTATLVVEPTPDSTRTSL